MITRDFTKEKNMDLINELLNCLNSIDYDIFDEDYLTRINRNFKFVMLLYC